jgi:C4-dicarboxylate-specific signal transduction histidine kinase
MTRRTFSITKRTWIGFGAVLLLFAVYFVFSFQLNRQLQEEAVRFKENFVWAVFQVQKEMILTVRQAERLLRGEVDDPEDVRLSFELMVSRLLLLNEGQGFTELTDIENFQTRIDRIMRHVAEFDDYTATERSPEEFAGKLIELFSGDEAIIQGLALDALHYASGSNTRRNQDVRAKLDGLAALYLLNTLLIAGLIYYAFRQAIRVREHQFQAEAEARERKFLEDTAETAKLQALGTLAGGVAHEINSPAQFISSNLEFAGDGIRRVLDSLEKESAGKPTPDGLAPDEYELYREELPKALEEAGAGIRRIAEIVRAIKSFAHPSENPKAEIDINEEIRSTILLTANQTKTVARVEADCEEPLPVVTGKRNDLNQVLINMIVNSAQAISEMPSPQPSPVIRISSCRTETGIDIVVSDNGPGIPDENLDRIFDPFFTTKPVGVGSGQGLAISRQLIDSSFGGSISVGRSTEGGAEFRISIPLGTATAAG